MESIKNFFESFFTGTLGILAFALFAGFGIGTIYWLWMAIQLGSFLMFLILFFPPVMIITGPVGVYSWIFGIPQWVLNFFG